MKKPESGNDVVIAGPLHMQNLEELRDYLVFSAMHTPCGNPAHSRRHDLIYQFDDVARLIKLLYPSGGDQDHCY